MKGAANDKLLVKRLKAGDRSAFRELMESYKDEAFSLACSIVKDPDIAEDILQEVFIKVFHKIKFFKQNSSLATWLYRIVVNHCYNELRKNKTVRNAQEVKPNITEAPPTLTDQNDLKKIIHLVLNHMKPDEALVLKLFYLSELKINEVMVVTGFKQSKVKVTLHRGRKSFAEILTQHFGKEINEFL